MKNKNNFKKSKARSSDKQKSNCPASCCGCSSRKNNEEISDKDLKKYSGGNGLMPISNDGGSYG